MPAQVHGTDLQAPCERSFKRLRQHLNPAGLPDADYFHQFNQFRLQTLSRGWGSPNWHVFSMGRITS